MHSDYVMDMSVYVTSMSVNPLVLGSCSGKRVCSKNVSPSKPFCENVCEPTSFNILPSKPVRHYCIYLANLSLLAQPLLIFSVHYKISLSNFYSLATVILLSKLTCFRKFIILHISWNSAFLRSNFNT